jgi:hypothetical protein
MFGKANSNASQAWRIVKVSYRMPLISKGLAVILSFFIHSSHAAKPPEPVLEQMEILARIEAAIQTCLDSQEFKKISDEDALKFYEILSYVSDIAEIIEKKYDDDAAYFAIKYASDELLRSQNFRLYLSNTYSRKCASQLYIDAKTTLSSVRSNIIRIKNK